MVCVERNGKNVVLKRLFDRLGTGLEDISQTQRVLPSKINAFSIGAATFQNTGPTPGDPWDVNFVHRFPQSALVDLLREGPHAPGG